MPNGGFKLKPIGKLNSQYKGGLVTNYNWMKNNCELGLSLSDISKLSNRGKRTVAKWLEKHNLKTLKIRKFKFGVDHHNYNGSRICYCGSKKSHGSKFCMKCRKINKTYPKYNSLNELKLYVRRNVVVDWWKKIFERDNYSCQKCGDSTGGNLQAHHIKRLSIIIEEIVNNIYEIDFNNLIEIVSKDENILSLNNGITLCYKCHKNLHKGKRKKNL